MIIKEEIKAYLKQIDELEQKLEGQDKETLQWLIYGYNECAKLLNQKERKIEETINYINKTTYNDVSGLNKYQILDFWFVKEILEILERKE